MKVKPEFDYHRFLAWLKDEKRKPANTAFTEGPERMAGYAVEDSGILGKARGPESERKERKK